MPWKKADVQDQRIEFVVRAAKSSDSILMPTKGAPSHFTPRAMRHCGSFAKRKGCAFWPMSTPIPGATSGRARSISATR